MQRRDHLYAEMKGLPQESSEADNLQADDTLDCQPNTRHALDEKETEYVQPPLREGSFIAPQSDDTRRAPSKSIGFGLSACVSTSAPHSSIEEVGVATTK